MVGITMTGLPSTWMSESNSLLKHDLANPYSAEAKELVYKHAREVNKLNKRR
jgi:hypothetical protein